jgi:acetyl esterase/lipase
MLVGARFSEMTSAGIPIRLRHVRWTMKSKTSIKTIVPRLRGAAILAASLLLAACATHSNRPETPAASMPERDFERHEQLRYSPEGWPEALHADIYQPTGQGPFPAVLLVHGGGWARGEPTDMTAIAEELAGAGFVVMNAAYRFAPEYRFPAQLHDLQQALRWLREEAPQFGVDSERVAGFGYSAGAHLVALLGLSAADEALDAPHGGTDTRLQAVVAGGTPTDLRKFDGGKLVPQFLGGDQRQAPEAYRLASPIVHVTPAAPPFFLYHGGSDMLVSVDHAEDFAAALGSAGVHVELYRMRLRGHITAFLSDGTAVARAIAFLRVQLMSE